jgi:hypothetical protein
VLVRVNVGVFVAVLVGVFVGVLVGVTVGVLVDVLVGVSVGVLVGVFVGVLVGVSVGVLVGVSVGVFVGVLVGVFVRVLVGVFVDVGVAVAVGPITVWVFPLIGPPKISAGVCVFAPAATIDEALTVLKKVSPPAAFRLNTSNSVCGAPGVTIKFVNPPKMTCPLEKLPVATGVGLADTT